jgi:hypothetical protein
VIAVYENDGCLLWELQVTHKYNVWEYLESSQVVNLVTASL